MNRTLQFSVTVPARLTAGDPPLSRSLARFAARAEELGFVALYTGDHVWHPATFAPSVAILTALAGATERVRIGFAAYQLPLRHPLIAAQEMTALDHLSNGRLVAGVATGSQAAEYESFGIPWQERGARLDEGLEALTRLWTETNVTFRGRFFSFEGITFEQSVQKPHPPIWIGSWSGNRRSALRVARYAAGWQASGLHTSVAEFREGWARIAAAATEIGRDPQTIRRAYVNAIVSFDADRERALQNAPRAPFQRDGDDLRLTGTPDDVIARLNELAEAGAEEVSLFATNLSVPYLERFAHEVMPTFNQAAEHRAP
jgi:alkanesulfonate monooxygenase SsuD/methylene tetrahydromethanopterin reductase-like flavin-dependent oxidoreductase (luciferase family)